jgi:hypothetical protein
MILNAQASYPHDHTYVVKLHRDSCPREGRIAGRLEHVDSGRTLQFNSAEELIAGLIADVATVAAASLEGGS